MERMSENFSKHKIAKITGGRQRKNNYPVRQCRVCSMHKNESERKHCEFCALLLHKGSCFGKHHTLKYYYAICVLKPPRDIMTHQLQHRNISRNILSFKNVNALKMSGNWGI
jgi:hypothetical protein